MGRLTTHVLDTARGRPAAGMTIDLFRIGSNEERVKLSTLTTNADGRVDSPLLSGDDFAPGEYELVFHTGAYQRAAGFETSAPAFLDRIPIRFGVADPGAHYHVPLLVSPFGYSTYRGS